MPFMQTFVEDLVHLPGCFLCYTPAVDAPPVSPAPAVANGFITFGSFNNLAKITPEVIALWAEILKRYEAQTGFYWGCFVGRWGNRMGFRG
jgi:predicted O-linked N-acetylglucosamine transferase (SPINDLY family)